jgi:O-succinylbenzoate synthase
MQILVPMHSRMKVMYLFQNPLIRFGLSIFGLRNLEILLMSHADYQTIKLIKIASMNLVRFVEEIYGMKLVSFQLAIYK